MTRDRRRHKMVALVRQWEESTETRETFARRHGLTLPVFEYWEWLGTDVYRVCAARSDSLPFDDLPVRLFSEKLSSTSREYLRRRNDSQYEWRFGDRVDIDAFYWRCAPLHSKLLPMPIVRRRAVAVRIKVHAGAPQMFRDLWKRRSRAIHLHSKFVPL